MSRVGLAWSGLGMGFKIRQISRAGFTISRRGILLFLS